MLPGRIGPIGCLALLAVLAAAAYGPLLGAGWSAPDLRTLADVAATADARGWTAFARELHGVHGVEGHALPALSLLVSVSLWMRAGIEASASWPLRAENLALLAVAGIAAGAFARRLLHPWTGSESARAAGLACALLVPLAPTSVAVVARVSARGDLLALVLGCSAGALLLRARQERQPVLGIAAGAAAILAGFCSDLALGLPWVFAAAEFASARRWRPERIRWRTAATTLLVFGACTGLQVVVRSALLDRFELFSGASAPSSAADGGPAAHAVRSLERLGVLLLPVSRDVWGGLGIALAAAAVFLALHPALRAARSAPRLWGWLACAWLGAIALCELLSAPFRVTHSDLSRADALLGSALVTSVGVACCTTAVSGRRRVLLPLGIAILWAGLALGGTRAWRSSLQEVTWLRADLELARAAYGTPPYFVVVDPPGSVLGVDAVQGQLSALLAPSQDNGDGRGNVATVRGLALPALLALAREPELDELRSAGLVLCFPRSAIGAEGDGRLSLQLPLPEPSGRVRSWREFARSPSDLDLEALSERALRVTATAEADTRHAPVARWRCESPLEILREGELCTIAGVWQSRGTDEEPPVALFDLTSSLAWLLAGRVRQVYSTTLGRIEEAEVLGEPAEQSISEPPLTPEIRAEDWLFAAPSDGFASDVKGRDALSVGLLDLSSWAYVELPATRDEGGDVLALGAAGVAREWLSAGSAAVAWTLESRVDGVVVWRARGRCLPPEDH